MDFPAQLLQTKQEWSDLVLPESTFEQLEEIRIWIDHHDTLLGDWGMAKKIKPGYRALFHGPPGTGKTLTATLLGKRTNKEVFRIDLSTVVSKFIGETEKNLATLFDKAQNKNWILFFDEADALFGKRTSVRDAHDKYANQEVSYLLQRIEEFSGLVILASNFKTNIDEAFTRRFQSIIYFPMPKVSERLQIWQNSFPEKVQLEPKIDLRNIAQQYELTGANIMNIVQYSCLMALSRKENIILLQDLLNGIRKELIKEGKIN
jgi:SpoVK/Ycf46/Vps4 family AAA+-type ATPase